MNRILPLALLLLAACSSPAAEPGDGNATRPAPGAAARRGQPPAAHPLAGTSWQLVSDMSYESRVGERPPAPGEMHVIAFRPDGTAELRFACNRGTARWSAQASGPGRGTLRFDDLQVTEIDCPGTRLERMAERVAMVASYGLTRGGLLELHLRADSGVLIWEGEAAP